MVSPRTLVFLLFFFACSIFGILPIHAQMQTGPESSTTPLLHYEFPFQTMWDDAVLTSVHSGKPALAFDLDLVDSNSIRLANMVIASKSLQAYIKAHFEPSMNDFAVDPPPSVGLDSLRNLGWRLSGLEKDYGIAVRPAIIIIGTDKAEIDRIVFPQRMTASELQQRLSDILEGRNTLKSMSAAFWRDTTSIVLRQKLIDMFEERSKYDSVLYHLQGLAQEKAYPTVARGAELRYAYLRLQIEGATPPIEQFMASLGKDSSDSLLHYDLLDRLREHYDKGKKHDSVNITIDRIIAFTGYRDPDLLNDYAWNLASYSKAFDSAWTIINEAIGKKGNDPDYYDTRALVNGRFHRMDDAIKDEETAITYASKDDQSYFKGQLGYYRKLKDEMAQAEEEEKTSPSTKSTGSKK